VTEFIDLLVNYQRVISLAFFAFLALVVGLVYAYAIRGPVPAMEQRLGMFGGGLNLINWHAIWNAVRNAKLVWRIIIVILVALVIASVVFALIEPVPPTAGLDWPGYYGKQPNSKVLVLFIHGYNGDTQETWKNFPQLLRDDDRFPALDIVSVRYPTYFRRKQLTIVRIADWIFNNLQVPEPPNTEPKQYEQVIVVAHSMGGLVARELALFHQSKMQFPLLIEIATPIRERT
jgi:hypothetical protein